MPDYTKGKIYKIITSYQADKIYIGSTTKGRLCDRITEHRSCYKNNKRQCKSKEILCFGDAQIILIETYPCHSKDELHQREQYWMDYYKEICVNKQKAFIGLNKKEYKKVYYEENKETVKEKVKKYYEENKEKKKEIVKKYYEENKEKKKEIVSCECGKKVRTGEITRHKKSKIHQEFLKK